MPTWYYTLFVLEDGAWRYEFGAYDRDDVEFERRDLKDHGTQLKNTKITTWDKCPSNEQINMKVNQLNNA